MHFYEAPWVIWIIQVQKDQTGVKMLKNTHKCFIIDFIFKRLFHFNIDKFGKAVDTVSYNILYISYDISFVQKIGMTYKVD